MSDDKRPSDHEIEVISRMARESSGFFGGLATALRPQESQKPSDKSQEAKSVRK